MVCGVHFGDEGFECVDYERFVRVGGTGVVCCDGLGAEIEGDSPPVVAVLCG